MGYVTTAEGRFQLGVNPLVRSQADSITAWEDGAGEVQSGCSGGTTHYIGDTSVNATQFTMTENILYCFYVQANCTGTLGYAHVYHDSTGTDNIKVAVYGDIVDPSAEPDGESMIGNAVELASQAGVAWKVSAAKVTGSVVSGTNYWLCHISDATQWVSKRDTTGGDSESVASSYTTPSNPMPSSGWSSNTYAYSMYVEIE